MLSITRGIPCLWARSETFSISIILELGLPRVSIDINLVLSLIASSKFFILDGSTKLVSTPYRGKVWRR